MSSCIDLRNHATAEEKELKILHVRNLLESLDVGREAGEDGHTNAAIIRASSMPNDLTISMRTYILSPTEMIARPLQ
jgi:hypothetical protein